ncbi:MAG: large conductance mechanosensitive channel protein MscL [Actinomycetota bacterium]
MLTEFKKFALRGSLLELAVAVILGLAFSAVVQSFANDVLMALIGGIFGQPNFSALTVEIGDAVVAYGAFINAVVNFLIVAFALFLVVKAVNRMMDVREETPARMRECPYCRTSIPAAASRCSACTSEVEAQAA